MGANRRNSGKKFFTFLSNSQLEKIHQATLNLLATCGVRIGSKKAAKIFSAAGAIVEKTGQYSLVKLPPDLVESCIHSAPGTVTYQGRIADSDYTTHSSNSTFTTFGECVNIIDPFTGKFRKSIKDDCSKSALFCDAIEEVKLLERPLNPSDFPAASQPLHNAEAIFSNTTKHAFIGSGNIELFRRMAKMAESCAAGSRDYDTRKIFSATICPVSPLLINKDSCDIIIEAARQGIGLLIFTMPLAGATSAVTLAGTLVSTNAEVLSGVVLAQLARKGTPCTYGSAATIMDLTQVDISLGAPELTLLSAAVAQLARCYEIPSFVCGGMTDSKLPDSQAGYEFSHSALTCLLAGGDIISGIGVIEKGLTFDYAKLIMDVEMIRYLSKISAGIDTSSEKIAFDVINEVGPSGEFLTHKHTYDHMRGQSVTELFNRQKRPEWLESGGNTLSENAYLKAADILSNYKPLPLNEAAKKEMSRIIWQYESDLGLNK